VNRLPRYRREALAAPCAFLDPRFMDAQASGAGAPKDAGAAVPLPQLEDERRALFNSSIAILIFGICLVFMSWNYGGALCAISAAAISIDSAKSAPIFAARLRRQLGPCTTLEGRESCCRKGNSCCNGPTCGALLHLYGLLVTVLVLSSIFVLANVLTLLGYSSVYKLYCAEWVDEQTFRRTCSAYLGGVPANSTPAYRQAAEECARLQACSRIRYEYVISALSLSLHIALIAAASFAYAAYSKLRIKVAGTPIMALVGATTGACGGPTDCGACCVPVPMPLAYLPRDDGALEAGGGAARLHSGLTPARGAGGQMSSGRNEAPERLEPAQAPAAV